MKGQPQPPPPGRECKTCRVRTRMGSGDYCTRCAMDRPVAGHKVTDAMRDQLHTLWQQSIDSQFRRD